MGPRALGSITIFNRRVHTSKYFLHAFLYHALVNWCSLRFFRPLLYVTLRHRRIVWARSREKPVTEGGKFNLELYAWAFSFIMRFNFSKWHLEMVIKTIHCMQFQVRCQPAYYEGVVDDFLNREKSSIANDSKSTKTSFGILSAEHDTANSTVQQGHRAP